MCNVDTQQYLSRLNWFIEHYNNSTPPVIDYLPEFSECGLRGTLGYDIGSLLPVPLEILFTLHNWHMY